MKWVSGDETIAAPALGSASVSERVASSGLVCGLVVRRRIDTGYVIEVAVLCHLFADVLCELHDLWAEVDEEGVAGPSSDEHDGVCGDAGHVHGHGGRGSNGFRRRPG